MNIIRVCLFFSATMLFAQQATIRPNPILFVTQTPTVGFTSVTQTFSNHDPSINNAPRGGDLMILYPDGSVRNLTREAGYGEAGERQGENAIAVRQPCVHWSGNKAVFSMVVGAPTKKYEFVTSYWQLYEVTGLAQGEQAVVAKVPHQYPNYNNISPIYGSDDNIIFTSDMPVTQKRYHYPPLDEYENAKVVSGLWKLDVATGKHSLLEHSPSGSFYPSIDSYGRIIFTRWDHLQRDQQADLDRQGQEYGTFNYSSEDSTAEALNSRNEIFPEPRSKTNPDYVSEISEHTFNQFFPWEINQDGTEEETINHVGRHEWGGAYTEGSFVADQNLRYVIPKSWVENEYYLRGDSGPFQIMEDPGNRGIYYAAVSPEFNHETSGQLIKFNAEKGKNPESMIIEEITHESTASSAEDGKMPPQHHSGRYRNPLPMSNGALLVVHTSSPYVNKNVGTDENPKIRYNFRLKSTKNIAIDGKTFIVADSNATIGFFRKTEYFNGNEYVVMRADTLWELDPVEVRPRDVPPLSIEPELSVESEIFAEAGVNEKEFRTWLAANNLGVIVSRNVVTRDRNDDTQPYNLRVPNGVENIATDGPIYDVEYLQIVQADLLRAQGGKGGHTTPEAGRRVLARYLHETAAMQNNIVLQGAPEGSVKILADGSIAAFVPAHRALSWQLTNGSGKAIVRERYWVTVQPGEVRVCASCHGVNTADQLGQAAPSNKPEALRELLLHWKNNIVSGHTETDSETKDKLDITVFPNPSNGNSTVTVDVSALIQGFFLRISDLFGTVIRQQYYEMSQHANNHKIPVDISDLSAGIYMVQTRSSSGEVRQKPFIVSGK